jgi:hypothetical protein
MIAKYIIFWMEHRKNNENALTLNLKKRSEWMLKFYRIQAHESNSQGLNVAPWLL